jgi:hypothetical protein
VGFDPRHIALPLNNGATSQLTVVQDYYSQEYAHYPVNLIVCRHAFDHIPNPRHFLSTVRQATQKNPQIALFFEVPNEIFAPDFSESSA